ncbi:MAG: class I SAM-dependent methyltransferase [Syntrophaceae bacterium]
MLREINPEKIEKEYIIMPEEKKDFNKASATWDQKTGRVKLAHDVAQAIMNEVNLTHDMDVLDFGCGTGLLTLQLQPLVRSITGVDSSQGMIDVLNSKINEQKLSNVKTELIDIEKGDVLKGKFHVIVSSMTLHHMQNIESLLKQLYECLLPGGRLCIADLDTDGGAFHNVNTGVFHFGFDRSAMRQLFIQHGFHGVRDTTAARVVKDMADQQFREFTVFLMTGQK